jgi:hypothetical protein
VLVCPRVQEQRALFPKGYDELAESKLKKNQKSNRQREF